MFQEPIDYESDEEGSDEEGWDDFLDDVEDNKDSFLPLYQGKNLLVPTHVNSGPWMRTCRLSHYE
jgi:hypothetical protein